MAFDSARGAMDKIGQSATLVTGMLTTLAGVVVTAAIKGAIDAADSLNKLSTKTGIAVENLTGWQHVMDLSGSSVDQFEKGVAKLNETIVNHPELLRRVGVTATDANGALLQLADVFARMPDAAQRSALAAEVFGQKVGREMIVALSGGKQSVEALMRAGQELNPISAEMAKQAEQFNDALETMRKRMRGVGVGIAADVLPGLNNLLTQLSEGIRISGSFGNALKTAAGVNPFQSPGENLKDLRAQLERIQKLRSDIEGGTTDAASNRMFRLFFGNDINAVDAEIGQIQKRIEFVKMLRAQALGLPTKGEMAAEAARQKAEAARNLQGAATYTGTGGKEEKPQLDIIDPWAQQRAAGLRELAKAQNESFDEYEQRINEKISADEADIRNLRLQRESMLSLLDPVQKYRDELNKVDDLLSNKMISPELATEMRFYWNEQIDHVMGFGDAIEKAKIQTTELDKFFEQAARGFQASFADMLTNGFEDGFGGIERMFRQTLARMAAEAVSADVTRYIFGDGKHGIGGVGGGGMLNAGVSWLSKQGGSDQNLLGNIASLLGFANGGAFDVGGTGGTDSQLVAFRATPGESVEIRRPDQKSGGGGVTVHIHVSGVRDEGGLRRSANQVAAAAAAAVNNARRTT